MDKDRAGRMTDLALYCFLERQTIKQCFYVVYHWGRSQSPMHCGVLVGSSALYVMCR